MSKLPDRWLDRIEGAAIITVFFCAMIVDVETLWVLLVPGAVIGAGIWAQSEKKRRGV